MTYTYVIMKVPQAAYDFIRAKLVLAGYHHAIHGGQKDCTCVGFGDGGFLYSDDHCPKCKGTGKVSSSEDEVCDLHGIAVQASSPEDFTTRALRLHDEVHEVAALTDLAEPGVTVGWAPEEAVPILAAALQEATDVRFATALALLADVTADLRLAGGKSCPEFDGCDACKAEKFVKEALR